MGLGEGWGLLSQYQTPHVPLILLSTYLGLHTGFWYLLGNTRFGLSAIFILIYFVIYVISRMLGQKNEIGMRTKKKDDNVVQRYSNGV